MILARRLHASVYFNDKVYVFGGCCDDPVWYTADAEMYDIALNTWYAIAPIPTTGGASAVVIASIIYVIVHGKAVFRYDPLQNIYCELSKLPVFEWHCFSALAIGLNIYLFGGACNGIWTKQVFSFDINTLEWREELPMKSARRRCAATLIEL
jgi:hypothetical protein